MNARFGIFFAEATGAIYDLSFWYFAFEYAYSFRIFYETYYHIPDKGIVILYRILTVMNCTHTWNNNLDFERRL